MKRYLKIFYKALMDFMYRFIYWGLSHVPVFKLYQPVYGNNKFDDSLVRECQDRWDVFSKHMPETPGSVLDIGCNIGYFSFQSAEKGHYAYGVEADYFNVTSCNAIKVATKTSNAVFVKQLIDHQFLKTMPSFDTVINLSVFHHWVKAYGAEEAQDMMRTLADKCQCLIFETGQPNEAGTKWQEKMSFMGDKPDQWISNFLKKIGFKSVEIIGTFPTGLTDVDRYLFVAKK